MKYRPVYYAISLVFLALSVFGILKWGLNLGVDFKGGAILEYGFDEEVSQEAVVRQIEEGSVEISSVQSTSQGTYLFKLSEITLEERERVKDLVNGIYPTAVELRFESVGPSIGPELVKKTLTAVAISAVVILLWVAYQFKSFKFGASAVAAMFHDSLILVGFFAFLGHYFQAEVDFLFVTAILTVLSFSVHDTIVVFDRIREVQRKQGGELVSLADRAVSETMVRSLNNSFTIIFMLVALILLGGSTIKWFAVALLIGTVAGTYSSPFVAVPLLLEWEALVGKIKKRS